MHGQQNKNPKVLFSSSSLKMGGLSVETLAIDGTCQFFVTEFSSFISQIKRKDSVLFSISLTTIL